MPGLQRSVLVVAREEVFADEDGEIGRLEEAAREEPGKKGELLKHLHVSRGAAARIGDVHCVYGVSIMGTVNAENLRRVVLIYVAY